MFAFPLALGTIRMGSLDCYRTSTGTLTPGQIATALVLAEMAFEAVLAEAAGHESDDLGEALLRIRGYAYVHDLPVGVVAQRIVERELWLEAGH